MKRFFKLALLWNVIKREAALVWMLLRSPSAPTAAKLVAVAAFAYLFMPIDILTDAIPILGWIDDAIIVGFLLRLAYKLLPPELYEQFKRKAAQRSDSGASIDPASSAR